jgi:hypothetical protein
MNPSGMCSVPSTLLPNGTTLYIGSTILEKSSSPFDGPSSHSYTFVGTGQHSRSSSCIAEYVSNDFVHRYYNNQQVHPSC